MSLLCRLSQTQVMSFPTLCLSHKQTGSWLGSTRTHHLYKVIITFQLDDISRKECFLVNCWLYQEHSWLVTILKCQVCASNESLAAGKVESFVHSGPGFNDSIWPTLYREELQVSLQDYVLQKEKHKICQGFLNKRMFKVIYLHIIYAFTVT